MLAACDAEGMTLAMNVCVGARRAGQAHADGDVPQVRGVHVLQHRARRGDVAASVAQCAAGGGGGAPRRRWRCERGGVARAQRARGARRGGDAVALRTSARRHGGVTPRQARSRLRTAARRYRPEQLCRF
jgi:hypothetical protein